MDGVQKVSIQYGCTAERAGVWGVHLVRIASGSAQDSLIVMDRNICLGSGKQFRLDKIWAQKKEANCLEASAGRGKPRTFTHSVFLP